MSPACRPSMWLRKLGRLEAVWYLLGEHCVSPAFHLPVLVHGAGVKICGGYFFVGRVTLVCLHLRSKDNEWGQQPSIRSGESITICLHRVCGGGNKFCTRRQNSRSTRRAYVQSSPGHLSAKVAVPRNPTRRKLFPPVMQAMWRYSNVQHHPPTSLRTTHGMCHSFCMNSLRCVLYVFPVHDKSDVLRRTLCIPQHSTPPSVALIPQVVHFPQVT